MTRSNVADGKESANGRRDGEPLKREFRPSDGGESGRDEAGLENAMAKRSSCSRP